MSNKKVKYPECEKLKKVSEESNKIGAFLDWLMNEKYIHLCTYEEAHEIDDEDLSEGYYGINRTIEDLLAEYFEIDMDKVEKERRQILEKLQKG